MGIPPIAYACIVQLRHEPLEKQIVVVKREAFALSLRPGPFMIQEPIYERAYSEFDAAVHGDRSIYFPVGTYLTIFQQVRSRGGPTSVQEAHIRVAEILALLDMCHPHWIVQKEFEGAVMCEGADSNPLPRIMKFCAIPSVAVEKIADSLAATEETLKKLAAEDRDRLRLMARWYRRACEASSIIDTFLFLYIAIEMLPGKRDIPYRIANFITHHTDRYPDPQALKEELGLRSIVRLRRDIVHQGRITMDIAEEAHFHDITDKLREIALECMRLLASLPCTGRLDRWVKSEGR